MRKALTLALAFAATLAISAPAPAQTPAAADALVARAVNTAREQGKVVLIEFGASWCTWCTRFNEFVDAPDVKNIIAANYVILNLTVQERAEKKVLENPGGQTVMDSLGGARAGLPFYAFLDGTGKQIASSNAMPDGTNIGFPANEQELAAFMTVLDRTAPKLSAPDRAKVVAHLKKTFTK